MILIQFKSVMLFLFIQCMNVCQKTTVNQLEGIVFGSTLLWQDFPKTDSQILAFKKEMQLNQSVHEHNFRQKLL